jgi:hypothetical protein
MIPRLSPLALRIPLRSFQLGGQTRRSAPTLDSAEKPHECFDLAHERKNSNDFDHSSVRPEALEG